MHLQPVRIVSALSALFWTSLLLHVYIMLKTSDNDMRSFELRYSLASSTKLIIIVMVGIFLSLLAYFRRASKWSTIALAGLSAFMLWAWYLSNLPAFLRPPLGDGSFGGAVEIWWRLHSALIGWDIVKIVFLLFSTVFWSLAYRRL